MADLVLPITTYSDDGASIQALRTPLDDYSYWDPELEAEIAEAIREYPDTTAPSWLAPSAVLGIIERRLLAKGLHKVAPG